MQKTLSLASVFVSFTLGFAGSAQARNTEAVYSVPVPSDRPDLVSASRNMASNLKFELNKDGSAELKYKIPSMLTGGESRKIHLTTSRVENLDRFHLDSADNVAHATCRKEVDTQYSCEVNYTDGLNLNAEKVMRRVETTSPLEEHAARREVGSIFIEEARGVLEHITLEIND